jgi:HAD superfamily phosphatase (TIGR01668 family)
LEQAQSPGVPLAGDESADDQATAPAGVAAGHAAHRGIAVFCPHRMVDSVTSVLPQELRSRGIQGVILDLDNTLVLWLKEVMADEVVVWLRSLQEAGLKLCIMSNSIFGGRSVRIAAQLGCYNVRRARKPSRSGFRRAMAMMGTTPATTAMVGDQMFTDIWGGNRVGMYTIMVKQMERREFIYTRYISRPPERLLLRWFKSHGRLV